MLKVKSSQNQSNMFPLHSTNRACFAFKTNLASNADQKYSKSGSENHDRFELTISEGVHAGHALGQVVAGRVRPAKFPPSGSRVEAWSGRRRILRMQNGLILLGKQRNERI